MDLYSVPFRSVNMSQLQLAYHVKYWLSQEKVSRINVNLCGIKNRTLSSINKGTLISNLNIVQYMNNYMKKTTQTDLFFNAKKKTHNPTNPEKKYLPTEENSRYNQSDTCHLPNHVTFFITATLNSIDWRPG